ncbi:MAG: class I SAM-dependent methyltransferase [Deltaproteobacteria bacterium]|nr:class I SAM-dependent methyltransferase [Deltaproteobacteria bacterium]
MACAVNDLYPLFSNPGDHDSVLDIGCGYGHFLEVFKDSRPFVRVAGHELQGEPASACEAKGFEVFTCNLEEISDKFDLIVLLDVAEHVPDPNRTFAACHSLLKMGGHIYIHTPRRCFWDSFFLLLAKIPGMGEFSAAWLRTRVSIFHLQLWTDKALEMSLKMAGFQLLYLKPELELSWPLERYARIYLGEKLHFPPLLVRIATRIADLLFVRLGTLRNKAVCLGQRKDSRESFV